MDSFPDNGCDGAIVNGLITSVLLETFILLRQMTFSDALKTAFGMSFISMLAMELSMNTR